MVTRYWGQTIGTIFTVQLSVLRELERHPRAVYNVGTVCSKCSDSSKPEEMLGISDAIHPSAFYHRLSCTQSCRALKLIPAILRRRWDTAWISHQFIARPTRRDKQISDICIVISLKSFPTKFILPESQIRLQLGFFCFSAGWYGVLFFLYTKPESVISCFALIALVNMTVSTGICQNI